MNSAGHLEQSLQRDIERIRTKVLEMARRDQDALRLSLDALTKNDRQIAYTVILRDRHIDELEKEIDRLCLEFLVRQQPVAGHLRFVYAAIKINAELERVGDYAESIARQVLKIVPIEPVPLAGLYIEIANLAIPMLHDAAQAFVDRNAELARVTMATEEAVDALRRSIDAELLKAEKEAQFPVDALTPLLTVARRFERVADQARNICEEVLYMCTGEYMKHKGAEVTRVLFVDRANAVLSQMAEGIASALGDPKLLFSSAGLSPTSIDRRTVDFMRRKDIDTSRQFSKSVEQVPNLEHYQVIIALEKEARRIFPPAPTKAVALEWAVPDPSAVRGSEEQIESAYEAAFQAITNHIRDLVEAMSGDHQT